MISLSSGHSAEYLTREVATGRESYYTSAVTEGEAPGRWYGTGAEAFGLAGEVDHRDMEALYAHFVDPRDERFRDPEAWSEASRLGGAPRRYASTGDALAEALAAEPHASPERRAQLRRQAGKASRSPVMFVDATFSVPKSVTVVHASFEAAEVSARRAGDAVAADAWARHREAVEAAIWAGNRAALDLFEQHAGYSRVGHHGPAGGRYIDAHRLTVASFFQRTNRDNEPQLHIHNAILNRVECADGQFRALATKALYKVKQEADEVAVRTMAESLTMSLGLTMATRPDGKAREVLGGEALERAMTLFSSRRRAITGKTAELVKAFEQRFGREPTALERDRLARSATFATRAAKSHDGETREEALDRWHAKLREELAGGLTQLAQEVLDRQQQRPAAPTFSPSAVIEEALAAVQEGRSAWTRTDLAAAISKALPDYLGAPDSATVRQLVDGLTDWAAVTGDVVDLTAPEVGDVPDELRLDDGRSAYVPPSGKLHATAGHVSAERALRDAAVERGAARVSPDVARRHVERLAEQGIELGVDQARAVEGVLTSGARLESLVGPAGTGKSFVLGALAKAWTDPETWGGTAPRMYGLAASQIATDVLAGEGLEARNIARWLGTQDRLAGGGGSEEDQPWRLAPGDLVVIDESAMASTQDVAAVHRHADRAGAKVMLTGDHRQLAAVGAGGAMHLVAASGIAYELADVRRFSAPWEREASLRLREGDGAVLEDYRKRGRIVDGGTVEAATGLAARAWLADHLEGRRSIMVVDTNEQAAQVASQLRADLVRLGKVAEDGVPVAAGNTAGVGDIVQARRNEWGLAGHEGNVRGPINRESSRVVETREDGSLVAERLDGGGRVSLPASYVAEHLALGYASTVHSAQGLTVDTSHAVVTPKTGGAALYVALTRGRDGNVAYVTTIAVPEDSPPGQASEVERRAAIDVLGDVVEREQDDLAALEIQEASAAEATSARTAGSRLADAAGMISAARTSATLDRLVAEGVLTEAQREAMAGDKASGSLTRLMRQVELAGHDPEAVLDGAARERSLDGALSVASVIHDRVTQRLAGQLAPTGDRFAERVPAAGDPAWSRYLTTLAEAADQRARELGGQVAEEAPRWAVEALGQPPADAVERLAWEERAGRVAAYRELSDHADEVDPLGPAPKAGSPEAHAAWHSAWRALGRPEAATEEAELSDGQLRVRVRAFTREEAWEPAYVADELEGTHRQRDKARQTATLLAARIETADQDERDQLARDVADVEAEARALDERVAELEEADAVRSTWLEHTSATRSAALRARAELVDRGIDPDRAGDEVTAEEWLAEHRAALAVEDQRRPITAEHDLAEVVDERAEAVATVEVEPAAEVAETAVSDIREVAAEEPARPVREDEGTARVPTAEETREVVERAQRALAEVRERQAVEEARTQEQSRREAWRREAQVAAREEAATASL